MALSVLSDESLHRRAMRCLFVVALACLFLEQSGSAQKDPLHIWVGKVDRAGAEKWVDDHLMDYESNYYTYVLDKVIALDFFSQFDKSNLLGRQTVKVRS